MSDAANLLSILRGELPVPPLNSPPPPQASSHRDKNHFDSLLDRFNSPPTTSTNTRASPVPSSVVRPSIQSRSNSNSLLALLQGGGNVGTTTTTNTDTNTREEIINQEKVKENGKVVKGVPNFNFVSPFQLLSSAAAAASSSASSSSSSSNNENNLTTTTTESTSPRQVSSPSFTPKQQQPSTDSSNPKTLNFPTTTQVPPPPPPPTERVLLPSDSKPLPLPLPHPHQLISIPPPKTIDHNLESDNPLFKEGVSSPESITPISLFTPNLSLISSSSSSSRRGGYRKIGISKTSLSWIVQPQPQQPQLSTSSNSKKTKRSKVSNSSSGSVRVIDRDSGGRVLIENPFSSNRGNHSEEGEEEEVVHLEFSKEVILQENEEKRGLLMLGSKGSLAIWYGNDQFQDRKGKDSMYKPRLILKKDPEQEKNNTKISLAKFHPKFPNTPFVAISTEDHKLGFVNVDKLTSRRGGEVEVEFNTEQGEGGKQEGIEWLNSDTEILDLSFSPDGTLLAYVSPTSLTILKVSSSSKPPCLESRMVLPSSIVSPPHEISFISSTTSTSTSSDTTTEEEVSVNKGIVISSENGTKIDFFQFKPYSTTLELEQEPSITIKLDSSTSTERGGEGGEEARGVSDFSNLEFNPKTSTLLIGGSSSSSRGSLFSFKLDFSSPEEGREMMMTMKVSKVLETRIETRLLQFVLDPSTTSEGEGEDGVLVLHSEGIQHLVLKNKKEELLPPPPPPALTNPFSTSQSPISNNLSLKENKKEEEGEQASSSKVSPFPSEPVPKLETSTSPPDTDSGRRMSLENTIHVSEETLTREERVDETSWEYMRRASIPINSNQDTLVSNDNDERQKNSEDEEEDQEEEENRKRDREVEEVLKSRRERERERVLEREKENQEEFDPVQIPRVEQVQKEDKDKEIKLSGALVNKAIKNMKAKTAAALNKDGNNSQGFSNTYKNYSFSTPTTSSTTSTIPPPLQAQAKELDSTTRTTTNESQPLDLPQSPTTPIAFRSPPPPSQGEAQQGARVGERLNRFEQDLPKTVESILTSQFEKYFNDNNKSLNRSESKASPVTSLDIPNLLKQVSQTTSQSIEQSLTRGFGLLEIQKVVSREIETKLEFTIGKILPREISSVLLDPDFLRSISSSLIPIIQDQVTRLILTGLVPSFKHTLNKSIDEILKEMKSEMVGVRKEIVKEQSSTVRELELEVKGLKSQVGELKGMMERMEKLFIANSNNNNHNNGTPHTTAVVAPTPPSFSSSSSNVLSPATSTTRRSTSISSSISQPENPGEPLPPIPRSETPLSFSYEDHLTTLLQPSESPLFPSLVQFLNNSSPTTSSRLDKIFPPSTGESSSRISMAVTLSLAFRLSELIKSKNETFGGLGSDEKIWLEWLKRAIGATCKDQQSPEFEAMIPKIIEMVLNNLVARGRSLMSNRDFVGAGEIRLVEQYVRARLSMF